ncbi:PAS domain S-box protein [Undibacterium cyanobacteriorum]|uniref:histidine kinase n=1 Tax=Undibacterium cyanobacteriorum TaxID=3073561 RepID=A0ABY9RHG0_9BURK|nr:PAS domain S-box protein [Undibacterium sp. 20NA77.5]WMW79720.1 PAS domain S-box protein [Undibacterium sp. 20NA77.5]
MPIPDQIPSPSKRYPLTRFGLVSWPWLLPIVLVLLFVAVLLWLPWQAKKLEANERQEQLIADTLWVEQALQFQFTRNQESLSLIAHDFIHIANDQTQNTQLLERLRLFVSSNHEIAQALIFDRRQQILGSSLLKLDQPAQIEVLRQTYLQLNKLQFLSPKPQCLPHPDPKQIDGMICRFPVVQDGEVAGNVFVNYRLQVLLDETVPWWFAQENELRLLNFDEKVVAKRAAGGFGRNVYTHNRALEFPQLNFTLHTNSIKTEPKLLSNLLVVSVVILSLGLVWSLIALWRDINRRLRAEGALRKEAAFRAAMENSLVTGLRARDMEGRLTYVNPSFCKMIGVPADELVGRLPPMPYWAPEATETYQERFAQILTGTVQPEAYETIYQRANGERFPVLIHESALVDEHGKQTGWMSSILDVSELKRAEELSRQHEEKMHANARLATMGEMASMLAHELNQPLAAISSYTTGALNILEQPNLEPMHLRLALEKARDQAQRAGQVIKSVHEFVRKRETARAPLALDELISNLLPLVELQAHSAQVKVQVEVQAHLPMVAGDRVLLEQVILNLSRNAIEAMAQNPPELRHLKIVVSQIHSNESDKFSTQSRVQISVQDRGHGINDEVAQQLFSPFFSTKSSGMGMGLNICRTAVEFHGGQLQHRPHPQGGTIFEFSLAAITGEAKDLQGNDSQEK